MGPSAASVEIATLATRQHGNVTHAQLRSAGLSRQEIRGRIAAGWLLPRHHLVYAVGHRPASQRSRWLAGVLTYGDGAALSHRAAGSLYGIVRGAVPTEVVVPTTSGQAKRDGIVVRRAPLPPEHVIVWDGIPVTTLLRTHLDLATVLRPWELSDAFEEAQVQFGFDPAPLAAEVLSRRGYRGSGRLWQVLDGAVDPARVRSILELRFLKLCAAHGIARPLVNEKVGKWTPDFLWPTAGLVVETDGEKYHRTAAKRRRDAEKDAALTGLGLTVLRLTWTDVNALPDASAGRVREALEAAPGWLTVAQWLPSNQ